MTQKSRIICIRDVVVDRANLQMNDYASGLPSPLAFLGLAAAMAPELKAERWELRVLPILHSVASSEGRTKPEMEPKSSKFKAIEIAEDMTGQVVISLLMTVPHDCSPDSVFSIVNNYRIAGGAPRPISKQQVIEIQPDGSGFRKIKRGFAMIPPERAENLLISTGDVETLASIAQRLYPETLEQGSGWQVPVAVGHKLLEDPKEVPRRSGTRTTCVPHVFSEPVLGIAELVSIRNPRLAGLEQISFESIFWQWWTGTGWILGHPAYNPCNPTPIKTHQPKNLENDSSE